MATVTIPSPSAFLDSPVIQSAPSPTVSVQATPRRKPSATKTRKPYVKKESGPTKPKQTKSRDGCKNCKEKRLKCDETKPACIQCHKKGVTCKGYEKVLKWRPQEDAFKIKTGEPKSRKNSSAPKLPQQPSPSPTPSITSPSPTHAAFPSSLSRQASFDPALTTLNSQPTQQPELRNCVDPSLEITQYCKPEPDIGFDPLDDHDLQSSTPNLNNEGYLEDTRPRLARTLGPVWHDSSPRLANILLPGTVLNARSQEYAARPQRQAINEYVSNDIPRLESFPLYEEDDVEEIIREHVSADYWFAPAASPTSSQSSSSSGGSWFDPFLSAIHGQPKLHHDSDEMLMMRFDTQTCGILSIKDGPTENPWRMILWPLAREEVALRHAITSLTAFHASKDDISFRTKGIEHMTQSLQLLSHRMASMELTTSLATTLVLAFCESWDTLVSTGIQHLRGAKAVVGQILNNYNRGAILPENEQRLGFLCRTWVYMDVIARLTSLESDNSEDFDIVYTPLCQPSGNQDVDILMGCASTMFPIIGRVANLVCEVRKRSEDNSLQIIARAKELKSRLEKWQAPPMFEAPEDQSTEVEQALWTAEAYRGATLLYLLQSVPEISYESVTETIAALAKEVLTNIANVPETSRAVIIHIFPLLAAGCEAVDPESRAFVQGRWESMIQRMKIQNLDKCLDVVREVWDRRDNAVLENQRRKTRLAASKIQTGFMPATIMKRKHSIGEESAPSANSDGKRRAIQSTMNSSSSTLKPGFLRRESTNPAGGLDAELTVRGRQHWAGVMKDHRWEVLIG